MAETWSAPAGEKDLWHVLVAPGDTKVLSLDQLDDFFRLDVINGSTPVWQPGMKAWLPLSVVAGLDDEEDESEERAPAPPARPAPRTPAPPTRAPRKPPAPPSRAASHAAPAPVPTPPPRTTAPPTRTPAPPQRSATHHPGPARPPHLAQTAKAWPPASPPLGSPLPAPPAQLSKTAKGWPAPAPVPREAAGTQALQQHPSVPSAGRAPAAAAWPGSIAPTPNAFNLPTPESLRPLVLPAPSFRPEPRRSALGSWMIGLAALAAAVVSLHRNDVLRDLAKSAGQEQPYLELERSVGSPGFGTPRAVERLPTLDTLTSSSAVPSPPETSAPQGAATAPAPTPVPEAAPTAVAAPVTTTASTAPAPTPETTEPSAGTSAQSDARAEAETKSTRATSNSRSSNKASRATKKAHASRSTPRRAAAASERAERAERPAAKPEQPKSASLGIRGGTNRFDPLNGSL